MSFKVGDKVKLVQSDALTKEYKLDTNTIYTVKDIKLLVLGGTELVLYPINEYNDRGSWKASRFIKVNKYINQPESLCVHSK